MFTRILFYGTFVCCLILATSGLDARLDDGLVGHWAFDDGKGDTVTDHSGNANDGTIEGKGTWVPGILDGALDFSRDDQTKVTIPNADALNLVDAITLAAWVNPRSVYLGGNWQERNCVAAKIRSYYLDFNEQGLISSYIYGPQPQQWVIGTTDASQKLNEWFHVAITYDGKEHLIYVNGKADVALARQGGIQVSADDFLIGYVDNDRYFDGAIDDVRLYERALSAEEIEELVSIGLSVSAVGRLPVIWANLKE